MRIRIKEQNLHRLDKEVTGNGWNNQAEVESLIKGF